MTLPAPFTCAVATSVLPLLFVLFALFVLVFFTLVTVNCHSPMPNMPSNFCQREEIGGKFAITPIIACMSFLQACELADGNFLERARLCNELSGCDNCPGLTQADADKSAKQQLLPPRQYKAIQWKSSRRNTMCGVTLSAIGWNTIMAAQAPFIIDCTVVGPAGPANCSFL